MYRVSRECLANKFAPTSSASFEKLCRPLRRWLYRNTTQQLHIGLHRLITLPFKERLHD
jgi:hypothetical protein